MLVVIAAGAFLVSSGEDQVAIRAVREGLLARAAKMRTREEFRTFVTVRDAASKSHQKKPTLKTLATFIYADALWRQVAENRDYTSFSITKDADLKLLATQDGESVALRQLGAFCDLWTPADAGVNGKSIAAPLTSKGPLSLAVAIYCSHRLSERKDALEIGAEHAAYAAETWPFIASRAKWFEWETLASSYVGFGDVERGKRAWQLIPQVIKLNPKFDKQIRSVETKLLAKFKKDGVVPPKR